MKARSYKKAAAFVTAFCMLFSFVFASVPQLSLTASAAATSATYNDYQYQTSGTNATITQYLQNATAAPEILFIPSEISYPVVNAAKDGVTYQTVKVNTLGNGSSSAFTNSKKTQYVFIPEGVTTIASSCIYDYNEVVGWSFPESMTTIAENAFSSSFTKTMTLYAPKDNAAVKSIAGSNSKAMSTEVNKVTVAGASTLSNGNIYPNGTYYIPKDINEGYKATFQAQANAGYKVAAVTVDGKAVTTDAKGNFEVALSTLKDGAVISATFEADPSFDMSSYISGLTGDDKTDTDDTASIVSITDKEVTAVNGGVYDFANATQTGKLIVTGDVTIKIRNLTIGSEAADTGMGGMAPPGMEGVDMVDGGMMGGIDDIMAGAGGGQAAPDAAVPDAGGAAADAQNAGTAGGTDAAEPETPQVYQSLNDAIVVKADKPCTIIYSTYNCNIYENAIDGEGEGTDVNGTFKLADGSIFTSLENTTGDSRYEVTIGPTGGIYYSRANMFYELTDHLNTAAILAGQTLKTSDYAYNYKGTYSDQGPFYAAYAYNNKTISDQTLNLDGSLITIGTNPDAEIGDADCETNTSAILARFGTKLTVNGLNALSYSRYDGPTEGSNFWGTNSVILADSYSELTVNDATTNGQANAVYATEFSKINVNGGSFNANYSGSHGLYVGYGGEIDVNASSKGTTSRDIKTTITTVDEASTTLATDTGGGIIEVYNTKATAYGLRSAGVYSIGNTDGDVRVYNSIVTSYLDGGFTSASGGLVTADNSIIQGVYALKARSGGGTTASVNVSNSKLVSDVDMDALESVGYKTDFTQYTDIDWANETTSERFNGYNLTSGGLNFYLDKMNTEVNYGSQYYYWGDGEGGSATYTKTAADGSTNTVTYEPYANAPGHSGGGKLGVIYFTETASYPMVITSSYLENKNYEKHASDSKTLKNYLIVSDAGSTANVVFNDQNSSTKWDKTGEYDETTELVGDFYAEKDGANAVMGPGGVVQSYSFLDSKVNVTLNNSEWIGGTDGNVEGITVSLDGNSVWYVDKDTTIGTLILADGAQVKAADGCEIASLTVTDASGATKEVAPEDLTAGTYTNVTVSVLYVAEDPEIPSIPSSNVKEIVSGKATITVDKSLLTDGTKLGLVRIVNGKKVLVNAKTYTVENGDVSISYSKAGSYQLIKASEIKKLAKKALSTVQVKKASKEMKVGSATTISLKKKLSAANVKSITYTTSKKSVATVGKRGVVKAKKAGKAVIKAKVTLYNGSAKTVKMTVKVK